MAGNEYIMTENKNIGKRILKGIFSDISKLHEINSLSKNNKLNINTLTDKKEIKEYIKDVRKIYEIFQIMPVIRFYKNGSYSQFYAHHKRVQEQFEFNNIFNSFRRTKKVHYNEKQIKKLFLNEEYAMIFSMLNTNFIRKLLKFKTLRELFNYTIQLKELSGKTKYSTFGLHFVENNVLNLNLIYELCELRHIYLKSWTEISENIYMNHKIIINEKAIRNYINNSYSGRYNKYYYDFSEILPKKYLPNSLISQIFQVNGKQVKNLNERELLEHHFFNNKDIYNTKFILKELNHYSYDYLLDIYFNFELRQNLFNKFNIVERKYVKRTMEYVILLKHKEMQKNNGKT